MPAPPAVSSAAQSIAQSIEQPAGLRRGSPVFLVGMMGAGKTTVGRLLAAGLQYDFLDADAELERRSGVRIATMFEFEGEAGFREREEQLLAELSARPGIVLATGGGAVLRPANREHLRSRGLVIFLDVAAVEIARRTQHDTSRPLLNSPDRRARIDALLEERLPLYRATAHLRFRSPARNPRRLAASILAHAAVAPLLPPAAAPYVPAGACADAPANAPANSPAVAPANPPTDAPTAPPATQLPGDT